MTDKIQYDPPMMLEGSQMLNESSQQERPHYNNSIC